MYTCGKCTKSVKRAKTAGELGGDLSGKAPAIRSSAACTPVDVIAVIFVSLILVVLLLKKKKIFTPVTYAVTSLLATSL